MDDDAESALEQTLADLGTLLVQMEKFRAAHEPAATALRRACLAIGDRARRAHRHGTLDAPLATELGADADAARGALVAWLAGVRSSPEHAATVRALETGDASGMRAGLVALFDGTTTELPPAALFAPVGWQRRGRPRPAAEIAEELARLRDDGIPGDDDPSAPGVDPGLPGVTLGTTPPPGAPLYLAIRGDARPPWVLVLAPHGDVVVPGRVARLAFSVVLADPADADLDEWAMDPVRLRRDLEAALAAHHLAVERR